MNIGKAFNSNYLKASDIEGENLVLTIASLQMEQIGQEKEEKPVLYFSEVERGLVLNKTNANTITQVLKTHETDDWIGKRIALYVAEVEFRGAMVESIRVRLRAPQAAAVGATPRPTAAPKPALQTDSNDLDW